MTQRGFDHNAQNGIYVMFHRSQGNWRSFCNKRNPVKRIAVYGTGRYVHLLCERGAVVEYVAPTCAKVFVTKTLKAKLLYVAGKHLGISSLHVILCMCIYFV